MSNNGKRTGIVPSMEGYDRIDYCTRVIQAIVTRKREIGPQNYFFFSGYLSGILLNSKPLQNWPFMKVSVLSHSRIYWFCNWLWFIIIGILNLPLV